MHVQLFLHWYYQQLNICLSREPEQNVNKLIFVECEFSEPQRREFQVVQHVS